MMIFQLCWFNLKLLLICLLWNELRFESGDKTSKKLSHLSAACFHFTLELDTSLTNEWYCPNATMSHSGGTRSNIISVDRQRNQDNGDILRDGHDIKSIYCRLRWICSVFLCGCTEGWRNVLSCLVPTSSSMWNPTTELLVWDNYKLLYVTTVQ